MINYQDWLAKLKVKITGLKDSSVQSTGFNSPMLIDDGLNLLSNLKTSSAEKIKGFVNEFNLALPVIESAGYELQTVEIRFGIPPKLVPHFKQTRCLDADEKKELLLSIQDKRYTKMLLSTLFKSSELQQSIQIDGLPAGVIQIELTAVPNIILVYGDY